MGLKIVVWNANGLSQHSNEVTSFLQSQNFGIMLVTEIYFTNRRYICAPGWHWLTAALLVKNLIKGHTFSHNCEFSKCLDNNNFNHLSTGQLFYWPSDALLLQDISM